MANDRSQYFIGSNSDTGKVIDLFEPYINLTTSTMGAKLYAYDTDSADAAFLGKFYSASNTSWVGSNGRIVMADWIKTGNLNQYYSRNPANDLGTVVVKNGYLPSMNKTLFIKSGTTSM